MCIRDSLGRAVKGITELITKPGLVSLDFADIRSIMIGSGMAMIGMGESDSGDRAIESVHEALNSPLPVSYTHLDVYKRQVWVLINYQTYQVNIQKIQDLI